MRKLLSLIVLLAAIAGFGYMRGWFQLDKNANGDNSKMTITVDKTKIHDDGVQAAAKIHETTQKVEAATGH